MRIDETQLKETIPSILKLRKEGVTFNHLELILQTILLDVGLGYNTFDTRDVLDYLDEDDVIVRNRDNDDKIELVNEQNKKFKKGWYD